ncbi:hypothetical protein H0H93_005422 [Arthromyces matolae]|nr:hypothetical protein H0H93_005422 [Arthromyces matolae]
MSCPNLQTGRALTSLQRHPFSRGRMLARAVALRSLPATMDCISLTRRKERMAFYANHDIGWVTGSPVLDIRVPNRCVWRRKTSSKNQEIAFIRNQSWCSNGKSFRVGEIDSDTVVPEDCFRDVARKMFESPDVVIMIIQHKSEVVQVAHHCDMECGPENNGFHPVDGKRKKWSEANVSEDFGLVLRLLLKQYTLRWATYSEGGFKEGVSLTIQDELARWQKCAYGECLLGLEISVLIPVWYRM